MVTHVANYTPFDAEGGRVLMVYETITLANNTVNDLQIQVPKGKMWWLIGGQIQNGDNVARVVFVRVQDPEGNDILNVYQESIAGGGWAAFIFNVADTRTTPSAVPVPIPERCYLRIYYAAGGASAGGDGFLSYMVIEQNVRDWGN